jgi:pimeloyl-[acyl-carrier protein] synthase
MNASAKASLDIDLGDVRNVGDPFIPALNAIREAEPVFWSEFQKGWFVTRFDDVLAGYEGKYPLSNVRITQLQFGAIPREEWPTRIPRLTTAVPSFANMCDEPRHTHLRKPLAPAFSTPNMARLRPMVRNRVEAMLNRPQLIGEFEFFNAIARPLTGGVIMSIMGMPDETLDVLEQWANSVVTPLSVPNPTPALLDEGERALADMERAFNSEIEKRKSNPSDDILTVIAGLTTRTENPWSPAEVLGTCVNMLLAGHESTASTMAMGVHALCKHPDQLRYLLAHPDAIGTMVAEIGRYVAMSACMTRVASEDFEWHGKRIRKGDMVYLWEAAAHRDPRVYERPDEFDLSRGEAPSLVFGRGIHFCLGQALARIELEEFFPRLFRKFDIEVLDDPLNWSGGISFRTLHTMNVRFVPRA